MFSPSFHCLRPGFIALIVLMLSPVSAPVLAQNAKPTDQLPEEFRGIKVYKLPTKGGQPEPNFGIYKKLSFEDINFERLRLALALSIRAVDHPATVEHIYFQDVHVNGIPVHIESFNQEFKLSNKDPVDVPAPLECAIIFADLDSLQPVRDMVDKDTILITGQSFIEVKLGTLETVAARARHVVIPVPLNEKVPLNLFEGKPFLHITAATILDNLVNPTSAAAISMAKEHLAKLHLDATLGGKVKPALYLLLTEYRVRDPKSNAAEQFSQSGTGFLVSVDGKLLTSKRVVAPWKFDQEVDFLIEHQHMVLDKDSVKIYAWPAGALVMGLDGQPDLPSALSTDHQSLKILRMVPDEMVRQDYLDPDSGKRVTLHLHAEGLSDLALLQVKGTSFQPLSFPDPPSSPTPESSLVLCSYPFGISQPQTTPRLLSVKVSLQGSLMKMEHNLDPGESGAPLLNAEGKVVALATSADQDIPIQVAQKLIP
jgi:S1-C subfamily serine protease